MTNDEVTITSFSYTVLTGQKMFNWANVDTEGIAQRTKEFLGATLFERTSILLIHHILKKIRRQLLSATLLICANHQLRIENTNC